MVRVALATLVAATAALFALWRPLRRSLWWYSESDAYQLWVLALTLLLGWTLLRTRRRQRWLWAGALGATLAGIGLLSRHAVVARTPGDLLLGVLRGARRRLRGETVYDLQGLAQSVNPSPFAILLYLPLAPLSDGQATVAQLVLSALALLLYLFAAEQRFRAVAIDSDTLSRLSATLTLLTTFFCWQRSVRLGQLDTILAGLLLLALVWLDDHRPWRQRLAAMALAFAAALKLAPSLLLAPLGLRWLRGIKARSTEAQSLRRPLLWATVALAIFGGAGAGTVGGKELGRFAANLHKISRGTTSGNNYSLVARVATYGDVTLRSGHRPIPRQALRWGLVLRVVTLGLLVAATLAWSGASLQLLLALWLAALPLLSPICWDIYFIWCGVVPFVIGLSALWGRISAARHRGEGAPATQRLLALGFGAAYLVSGTMGNTVFTDLHSGARGWTRLPRLFDEAPLVGHLLLLVCLVVSVLGEHRRERAQRGC